MTTPAPTAANPLDIYLNAMVDCGASDLFLNEGEPPTLRVNGELTQIELPAPTAATMRSFLESSLTPIAQKRFEESPDADIAVAAAGSRFRINLFLHGGKLGLIARHIPVGGVDFSKLGLPEVILNMAEKRSGLILVVGPTGCGKSTTLASLINHINHTRSDHIVTIEDPIEFLHLPDKSLIHQRQVGVDTESFATALRHVVRQSPDAILIGEMRDTDTMTTALNAALTGHLVLTTLHTTNVVQSIDRILNYFPPEARPQAQIDLAQTLVGIVSMRLIKREDTPGRTPAVEVLLATPTVRKRIAEGEFSEIYDLIKRGQQHGMITLNQSLVELVQNNIITQEQALPYSPNPDELRMNISGMYTGISSISRTEEDEEEEPTAWRS